MEIVYDGSQTSVEPEKEIASLLLTTEVLPTTTTTASTTDSSVITTVAAVFSSSTARSHYNESVVELFSNDTVDYSNATTKYAPPPHFVFTTTDMPEGDPQATAFGVFACVSAAVLLIMLYMTLFGKRMGWTAIRWHVLNCSVWGLLHLAHYSSFADTAPFPNWIRDKEWRDKKIQVECFTRSVFPAGMFFIFVEQMLLVCAPKLAKNVVFNLIFAFLMVPLLNGIMIFCFVAQYMDYPWYYNPIELFNLFTYLLFTIMVFFFFVFCLFGTCCCCFVAVRSKKGSHTVGTYVDMWLLFPYALIPSIMYGPSFGITSVGFVTKVLMKLILESGLLDSIMGGGGDSGGGDGGTGGTPGGGGGGSSAPPISLTTLIDIMTKALQALPWFVLLFPLVQAILTIICIKPFREQFFFLLTCGRCYSSYANAEESKKEEAMKQWTQGGVAPYPVYPAAALTPLKLDTGLPSLNHPSNSLHMVSHEAAHHEGAYHHPV